MNKYIIVLILVLGIFSCRKNQDIISTTENEYPVEQYVVSSLKGKVVSDRDKPINGATVVIGEYTRKTDFNGIFYFKNIKANKDGSTISVSKEGFTEAKKMFYPQLNSTSYIKIKLEVARTTTINTKDKDKIVGDKVNKIQISGNSFKKNGNPYTGFIIINWLFVAGDDKPENQIADPVGFNKSLKLIGLNSYGILGFKVLDELGNQVEISDNNTYELKLGINNSLNDLDDNIPLWRFNVEKGKWLEMGKATYMEEDGRRYYYAEVKKSGYYNFAKPFKIQKTNIKLATKKSVLPYTNAVVETANNSNYKLQLISNDKGVIPCFIPADNKSKIILSFGESTIEQDIEGEINNINLENDINSYAFVGRFLTCNDSPLSNGYITIFNEGNSMFYFMDEIGIQSRMVVIGNKNIYWIATDLDSEINTGKHKTTLSENRIFNAGKVYLCQEPFALMQYGDDTFLLDLTIEDEDVFSLTFENGKALYEINSYPFKGIGEYNLDNCNCTPTIKNSEGERLYIYSNMKHKIFMEEYDKPGMIRGGLEAKVRTEFSGTDTTDLKIYYSVFNE